MKLELVQMNIELSIIIPVYNSELIVEKTISELVAEMKANGYSYEILLVNDGSKDASWPIIKKLAQSIPQVRSFNLLRNYGQHTAVLCGMQKACGQFLVTMDDDLQNPPSEVPKLYNKIKEGYDVVFGQFPKKKHAFYRQFGTKLINYLNRKIFDKPKDLRLTNFRIFTKDVSDRVLNYRSNYPYIPGLLLLHANSFANVDTLHQKREIGNSNYSIGKIIKLVSRLLINYSAYPLNLLTYFGIILAFVSFLFSLYILIRTYLNASAVPGWASLMFMLSFLNGISITMMGVLGIYVSRTLTQISSSNAFYVKESVNALEESL